MKSAIKNKSGKILALAENSNINSGRFFISEILRGVPSGLEPVATACESGRGDSYIL